MDTLPLIIVTAVVTALINGAVSVAIFRRVEENIKLEFSQQLEIFKTELQKDVVEHQVKFSRTYPKMLEVLETLSKKLGSYETKCDEFLNYRRTCYVQAADPKMDYLVQSCVEILTLKGAWEDYFNENRFFLPDPIISELEALLSKYSNYGLVVMILTYTPLSPREQHGQTLSSLISSLALPIDISAEQDSNYFEFFTSSITQLHLLRTELEKIYKSVALSPN